MRYQKESQPLGNIEIADTVFGLHSNYPKPILWIREAYPMFLSSRKPSFDVVIRYQKNGRKAFP